MSIIPEKRSFSQTEPLLDLEMFKQRYLFGVDLRDGNGNAIADDVIEAFVAVAIDYIEHMLEAPIEPTPFTEFLDYKMPEYRTFVYIQTVHYPIVELEEVKLKYGNGTEIDWPEEWYKLYGRSGQIQLLPTFGTFNRIAFSVSGQVSPGLLYGKYAPQVLFVKGKYGLADAAGQVQPLINQAVGLYAAIYLLQMLGDIGPAGPGVQASSISMDGLAQSISTSNSAMYNLFGSTVNNYMKFLKETVEPMLRKRYKRMKLTHI